MKVCALTKISSPAPEICSYVLFSRDERVFLYSHGLREHTVILVSSILQVNLLPARYSLKRLIPHTTARHFFGMIRYSASAGCSLLGTTFLHFTATVQLLLKPQMQICSQNKRFHQVRKPQYCFLQQVLLEQ